MIRPLRIAREIPTFGSKGDPVETCRRDCCGILRLLAPDFRENHISKRKFACYLETEVFVSIVEIRCYHSFDLKVASMDDTAIVHSYGKPIVGVLPYAKTTNSGHCGCRSANVCEVLGFGQFNSIEFPRNAYLCGTRKTVERGRRRHGRRSAVRRLVRYFRSHPVERCGRHGCVSGAMALRLPVE